MSLVELNEEQELKMLEKMEQESKWFNSIYSEIKEKFKNKYIATKDKKILVVDEDFDKLIGKLEKSGEDSRLINIQFIPSKDLMLIL